MNLERQSKDKFQFLSVFDPAENALISYFSFKIFVDHILKDTQIARESFRRVSRGSVPWQISLTTPGVKCGGTLISLYVS